LGPEWFELTNACVEEGIKHGMENWLYDEDRWPSGTAGGLVTENPEYRMKLIHMEKFEPNSFDYQKWHKAQDKPLGVWSCRLENEIDIFDIKAIDENSSLSDESGRSILAFCIIPMAEGSFYNGNTYVDTMKRAATDEYIRITHEAYKKHCGQYFDGRIKGIFTDEPHRGPYMSGFGVIAPDGVALTDLIPWTESIFDAFESHHNVRVENHLPELFLRLNAQPVSAIKAQYADTMLRLFIENYAKPYYDWCEENNLLVTGHVLHENSLSCQVSTNGSVQRYYPHMHIPGIDYLGEHGREYWVAKQVDSTARQFKQPWILSELYGCTGWQMNFESHKAIGAWQTLFGVNLRCHHLSWYTMAGEAKRDYPASILHQSPWHKEYDNVESWFARFGYFRSQGKPCCELLVLNPVESVSARVYPKAINGMSANDKGIRELEKQYSEIFHILVGNHIDFDYGDEALLAEHGGVVKEEKGVCLSLGAMRYSTVLVAGMDSLRSTTLQRLQEFVNAGGRVIFAGDPPAYIDSLASDTGRVLSESCQQVAFEEDALIAELNGHCAEAVSITLEESGEVAREVFCQLRRSGEEAYLSILNMQREGSQSIEISLTGTDKFNIEEWNLESGDVKQITSCVGEGMKFKTTLHSSQARCFRLLKSSLMPELSEEVKANYSEVNILKNPCAYRLQDANICVLDLPNWSLNDEQETPANDILQIDRELRKKLDVPLRAGDMVQPWFRGKGDYPVLGQLNLRYPFEVASGALDSLKNCELVMETPKAFKLMLNGNTIDTDSDKGSWVDIAFRRIALPEEYFVEGINQIELHCDFREDINLEALYFIGDFSVAMKGTTPYLSPLPTKLNASNLVDQGFPFYSGGVHYEYDVPKELIGREVLLKVPSYEGAYLKVSSANKTKMISWRPNEVSLVLGENLELEICITRKNTFGPLHLKDPVPNATGPHSFVPGKDGFSLEPVLIESGLLKPVEIHY